MAQLPGRTCRGRCGSATNDPGGYCPRCAADRHREIDRFRGSARERGYDRTWEKLRNVVRSEEPLCRMCLAEDRISPTEEIDHIVAFHGIGDPRRLDRANLQGLCGMHHRQKTRLENPRCTR
jgi:5-methylcytosine-specific restriction protein A